MRKVTGGRGLEGDNYCFPRAKERVYRDTLPSNQIKYNSLQFPPLHSVYSISRKYCTKQEMSDYKTRKQELDHQITEEEKVLKPGDILKLQSCKTQLLGFSSSFP